MTSWSEIVQEEEYESSGKNKDICSHERGKKEA
jgi:hypothetical protein